MLFYSALHYVEAFLMTKIPVYRDHQLRDSDMRRWGETRAVYTPYARLKKAASEARYEGTQFRPVDFGEFEECHRRVRDAMLAAVR